LGGEEGAASKQASKQQVGSSNPCHDDDDAQYSHSFIHFIQINPANFLIAREKHKQTAKALLMKTTKWTNAKQK
jgi:hypothetical protein